MLSNSGLVEYCKKCLKLKTFYMWGSFGQKITNSFITTKIKQYPDRYSAQRIRYLTDNIGSYAFDCVGLIKSYYWGGYGNLKYKSSQDLNATGMYDLSPNKGSIGTLPEIPGLALYKKGHIGVYIGSGKVIEATLSSDWEYDGVELTSINHQKWTHWLQVPYIEEDPIAPPIIVPPKPPKELEIVKDMIKEREEAAKEIIEHPKMPDDKPRQKKVKPFTPSSRKMRTGLSGKEQIK